MPGDGDKKLGLEQTQVESPGAESLYGPILGAGAIVGAYLVERFVSRGGFGSIYRARHGVTGAPAAVKLLHAHMRDATAIVRRFYREAEAIRRVRHEHVVELYEFGQLTDGRPYLVMEWLSGRTLELELVERGALPLAEVAGIVEELASGLAAAHALGLVHRDLKAANVMLVDGPDGRRRIKLLDFGIAKDTGGDATQLTRTGVRLGTPAYMAPEQILGGQVSPQTDVYALGVLIFHMLTGRLPFGGQTAIEIEDQHLNARPPRPSDVSELRGPIDDVLMRCLEKEPAARYPTVQALAADVRACERGEERPSRRFRSGECDAVGLWARARAGAPAGALQALRERCVAAGALCVVDLDDELLAVVPAVDASKLRAAAHELLAAARASDAALAMVLHAARVQTLVIDGTLQVVGGDLLDPGTWGAGEGDSGLTSTAAATTLLG